MSKLPKLDKSTISLESMFPVGTLISHLEGNETYTYGEGALNEKAAHDILNNMSDYMKEKITWNSGEDA